MSSYNKKCIYCNKEIRLSDDSGKWLPYNLDGTAHECKDKQQQTKQVQRESKSSLTLEQRVLRIEQKLGLL